MNHPSATDFFSFFFLFFLSFFFFDANDWHETNLMGQISRTTLAFFEKLGDKRQSTRMELIAVGNGCGDQLDYI